MKKKMLLCLMCVVALEAKDLKLNEAEEIERFYYNKGYSVALQKGFKDGYEEAFRDFRKKLREYKSSLAAVEAGKYLYKEGRLRYPEVYRIRDKSGYTVKIIPPKIVGELTLKELGRLPEKYISDGYTDSYDEDKEVVPKERREIVANKKSESWVNEVVNSFRGAGNEKRSVVNFSKKRNLKEGLSVMFEKNDDILEAINSSGVNYTDRSNSVLVKFKNKASYRNFCEEYFDGECK